MLVQHRTTEDTEKNPSANDSEEEKDDLESGLYSIILAMHTHINLARYRVPATNNVSAHCKSKIDIGYCCYYRCCYEYTTTTTRFTIHIIIKLPGAVDNDDLIRFDAFSVFLKTHTSLHYKYVCNNTVGVFYINHLKKNSYQSILMMTMILMATTK